MWLREKHRNKIVWVTSEWLPIYSNEEEEEEETPNLGTKTNWERERENDVWVCVGPKREFIASICIFFKLETRCFHIIHCIAFQCIWIVFWIGKSKWVFLLFFFLNIWWNLFFFFEKLVKDIYIYICIIYVFSFKDMIHFINHLYLITFYDGRKNIYSVDGWFLVNLCHVTLIYYP